MNLMVRTEELAETALSGDALKLRSQTQDWLSENPSVTECAAPSSSNATVLAIAAGLVELFADRRAQAPPTWALCIAGVAEPIFLVEAAKTMRHLRHLCETESPWPLRRRNLLAPPNFLESI
jgi:hypothetical protein